MAHRTAIAGIILLGLLARPAMCSAAQSASYGLSGEAAGNAEHAAGVSGHYALDGGITWHAAMGVGARYRIVAVPPQPAPSSPGIASPPNPQPPPPGKGGGRGSSTAKGRAAASRSPSAGKKGAAPSRSAPATQKGGAQSPGTIRPSASPAPSNAPHPSSPPKPVTKPRNRNGKPVPKAAPKAAPRPTRSLPAPVLSPRRTKPIVSGPSALSQGKSILKSSLTSLGALLLGKGAGNIPMTAAAAFAIEIPLLFLLLLTLFRKPREEKTRPPRRRRRTPRKGKGRRGCLRKPHLRRAAALPLLLAFAVAALTPFPALATVPQSHVYDGHLLTTAGTAVTTEVSVRFSEWSSADAVAGDRTGTGAVNAEAAAYLQWTETHTLTPDSRGYFSVTLGSIAALPDYAGLPAGTSVYLQVEVKAAGSPNTAFELLDTAPANAAVDRAPVLSVPFATEAGTVQGRSPGTGSGSLPVLGSGGLLPSALVPGGTNRDFFTIDADNSAADSVVLRFGAALEKTLSYSIADDRFEFNDSVRIAGDLTVTGLVNGIDLTDIESTAPLKLSASGSLNAAIAAGNYRINGTTVAFAGSGGVALQDDATNYVFFTSSGLTVSPVSFPTDKSFIPVARVTTASGAIAAVTDRRVFQSDDRGVTVQVTLHPAYEGSSFQADGTDNVGRLSLSHDNINLRNFYLWTSTQPALQDYDILAYVTLPPDFIRWTDGMTLAYRSTSASAEDNSLLVQAYDTNGTPVSLSGSTVGLASASWAETHVEFLGNPTWTAGQKFLVRLRLSARGNYQMQLGDLRMSFDVLH